MAIRLYRFIFAATLAVFAEAGVVDNCDLITALRPNEACGEVISFGLNSNQIQEILDIHKLSNFGPLEWSDELATRAQASVNQCQDGPDRCGVFPGSSVSRKQQNSGREPTLAELLVDLCPPDSCNINIQRPTFQNPDIAMFRRRRSLSGDYTDKVGCGLITIKPEHGVLKHLTCYYGPRGNSNGQPAH